ncbi:MAG: biopolymer transporter ExbD [Verrucomicrobiota bacterium]
MTFKTHVEIVKGRIDPAPMVDIVFLLLIFLVLSSPFVLQPGYGLVDLPTGGATSTSLQEIVITVSRDNLLFYNAQPTTLEKLPDQLRRAAREAKNPELIVKIDRQVSYATVIQIFDLAFDAGITAVNLATRPAVPVVPAK